MATYYIKNDGSDNYSGLSDASAWQTIIKVRATTLIPGDNILFKRGSTWVVSDPNGGDALYALTYSGSTGYPITYDAYGSGLNPIITGRQAVLGWNISGNWTNSSTNIWYMTTNIDSNTFYNSNPAHGRLWLNGIEKQKYNSLTTVNASLPWTHNGQILYVYATSNPASYYSNIESIGPCGTLAYLDKNYLTIQNIDFHGGGNQMILTGSYCIVNNCSIGWDCTGRGIYAYGNQLYGATGLGDHNVVSNNTFNTNDHFIDAYSFNNTEDGISMYASCNDWNIYGNTFISWGHSALELDTNTVGYPTTNIKFHHNFITAPDTDYGRGIAYNATYLDPSVSYGNEFYNNYIYNTVTHNQISGDGVKFYNNIIDTVRGRYAIDTGRGGTGLNMQAYSGLINDCQIYNNIIMNCWACGIHVEYSTRETKRNLFINNIIFNNGQDGVNHQIRYENNAPSDNISNNTFKNNIIYSASTNTVIYYENAGSPFTYTIAGWQVHDGSFNDVLQNNIQKDPSLLDILNYHLKSNSPAIHAGINVGLSVDYDGVAYNNPPSIGAYEYVGTTYYVANAGSDSSDGLTQATAWKTIAKVNTQTFNLGDQILFNAGDTWRETLIVPSSGASTNYITFSNYGIGNKPKIYGSTQITSWTNVSTNKWKSDVSVANPYVSEDPISPSSYAEIFFVDASSNVTWGTHQTFNSSYGFLNQEYDWTWDSSRLFLFAVSDPGTRYFTIEAPQRSEGIRDNDKQYLKFQNFDIRYVQAKGIGTRSYPNPQLTDLIIDGCNISYVGVKNGNAAVGIGEHYSNMNVKNCVVHDIGRRGLSLTPYGTNYTINNVVIENNTFYSGFHTTGPDIECIASGFNASINNITIRNNLLYDDPYTTGTTHLMFLQNYAGGSTITGINIYNNIFKYPISDGLHLEAIKESSIYNNVFYGHNQVNTNGGNFVMYDLGCTNSNLKNNIFYGNQPYGISYYTFNIYLGSGTSYNNINADYNLHFDTDARNKIVFIDNTHYYYPTTWSALKTYSGWESHSPIPQNPSFFSTTNYHLQNNSPAIHTGVYIGIYPTDYDGSLWNNPPSIGAYEYSYNASTNATAPTVTTAAVTSITNTTAYSGGNVTSDGSSSVTARGVCWSTSLNPSIGLGTKTSDGTGTGSYISFLSGLSASTNYYVRAYATNSIDTSYGSNIQFTTTNASTLIISSTRRLYKINNRILLFNGHPISWQF